MLYFKTLGTDYAENFEIGNLNNFKDWLSVCWIGRHLNNTDEGFKLFSKWSRKVKGYEKEAEERIIFINKINMI